MTPRRALNIGLVIAVVALLVGAYFAVQSQNSSGGADTAAPRTFVDPSSTEAGVTRPAFDLKSVPAALEKDTPYVITVGGDSTGNGQNEWVYLLARRIAKDYDRPVTVHDWGVNENRYVTETKIGGKGAPITIWNGSASGKDIIYTIDNWSTMAPEQSDLVFISHGHNVRADRALPDSRRLAALATSGLKSGGGVAVVLQNPRVDTPSEATRQDDVVSTMREWFGTPTNNTGVALIDVYSAYTRTNNVASLVDSSDRFHPNDAGEQLWANTVAGAMGIR